MKKIFIILIVLMTHNVYASAIQHYLTLVYPTSPKISAMSESQAKDYYQHDLHFWYRVPIAGHRNGLLAKLPPIFYDIYMQSDAVAVDGRAGDTIGHHGFRSTTPQYGSNKNHIEVSSFGASVFYAGAYFYWAPGSGVYINTNGSTIVGYNKIDVIYKLQGEQRTDFIKQLANIAMVQRQIWGVDKQLSKTILAGVCRGESTYFYAKKYPGGVHGLTLLGGLRSSGHWHHLRAQLCSGNKSIKDTADSLLAIYLDDHHQGYYDLKMTRYAYIIGEANEEIDQWLYRSARKNHVAVLQITRAPNNYLKTAFEICDTRWPAMDPSKTTMQQLFAQWRRAVKHHWYQLRDPFALENNSRARDISINYTSANKLEDFMSWFSMRDCAAPLNLNNRRCHAVQFAIDNSAGGGFSMTDVKHNLALFTQNLKTVPSSHLKKDVHDQ